MTALSLKNSYKIKQASNKQNGAVIVEFSLIAGLLIITLLAIIDLGRIFYLQSALNKAADNALAMAQKISAFAEDTRLLDPSDTDDQIKLTEYLNSVQRIENSALSLMGGVLIGDSEDSFATLRPVKIYETNSRGLMEIDSAVAILRPGGSVKYSMPHSTEVWFNHPTHCNEAASGCYNPLPGTSTWHDTLKTEPLIIEIRATLNTYLGAFFPVFNSIALRGRAIGFRELQSKGATRDILSVTTVAAAVTAPPTTILPLPPSPAIPSEPTSTTTSETTSTTTSETTSTSTSTTTTIPTTAQCNNRAQTCFNTGGDYRKYSDGNCYCYYSG
ncbi:MAG: TadE/TadG family type IV pilus assembly protein [bacterium]|nr:TadE/TadG family type IV pilus assembly protein [bacterium]